MRDGSARTAVASLIRGMQFVLKMVTRGKGPRLGLLQLLRELSVEHIASRNNQRFNVYSIEHVVIPAILFGDVSQEGHVTCVGQSRCRACA
jgi:hypothetical protein